MYLLIRRACRRRRKTIKHSIPQTPCNSLASEADVSQDESKMGKIRIPNSVIKAISAVKPTAELALAKGFYFNIRLTRS